MRHCWHDTRQWLMDVDGARIVQHCCHCPATREVGLADSFVIEGDRPHGSRKPNYVTHAYSYPAGQAAVPQTTRAFAMSGSQTVRDEDVRRIVNLGFRTTEGLRTFLREVKKGPDALPERKEEARIVRRILRSRANTERFQRLAWKQGGTVAA